MRTEMLNKPDNYPKQYLEFHLTTAEKDQLKKWAEEDGLPMGQYVRWRLFGVRPKQK